jgi:hypothetical protein
MLGNGTIGRFAITERPGGGFTAGVLTCAGAAAFVAILHSFQATTLTSAGHGVFSPKLSSFDGAVFASAGHSAITPILHSFDGAAFTSAGLGSFNTNNTRIDNRTVSFAGVGTFSPIAYAFFLDAEKACAHQDPWRYYRITTEYRTLQIPFDPARDAAGEVIVATVQAENRTALVPPEDRVYEVGSDYRSGGTENRKRVC